MTRKPPLSPVLVLVVGIFAASTAAIFIRYAQKDAPSLVIAAYRLSIATLVLSPIALTRHRGEVSGLNRQSKKLALLSGVFLAFHFAAWISSLQLTTVASSVVLVSTTPLWVALLSPITIKEHLSRNVMIGMVLALIGSIVVGVSDACTWDQTGLACPSFGEFIRGKAFLGDFLALLGAWMAAGYLLIGRYLRAGLSLVSYIFIVYGIAAVTLILLVFGGGLPVLGFAPSTYLWFLVLALVPQLLGHSSFNYALGYLSAAYVSISLLGEPIGSTVLAYFILGEKPGWLKIIGAILILTGIYIASQSESRKTSSALLDERE